MFDEVVVRVFRVGERTQIEGVDGRQVEQFQLGGVAGQEWDVVFDDVVAYQTGGFRLPTC